MHRGLVFLEIEIFMRREAIIIVWVWWVRVRVGGCKFVCLLACGRVVEGDVNSMYTMFTWHCIQINGQLQFLCHWWSYPLMPSVFPIFTTSWGKDNLTSSISLAYSGTGIRNLIQWNSSKCTRLDCHYITVLSLQSELGLVSLVSSIFTIYIKNCNVHILKLILSVVGSTLKRTWEQIQKATGLEPMHPNYLSSHFGLILRVPQTKMATNK